MSTWMSAVDLGSLSHTPAQCHVPSAECCVGNLVKRLCPVARGRWPLHFARHLLRLWKHLEPSLYWNPWPVLTCFPAF
jgi:hypothetical protein